MAEFLEHLHPMVVHFPIALLITAFVLEIASWLTKKDFFHQCALCLYVFSVLMIPFVVKTGLLEEDRLKLHHPLLEQHERYALWMMWWTLTSLPVLWFFYHKQRKFFRALFIVSLLGAAVLVTLTGDRGGKMVYEYGVGVEQ
ncbi:MAG: hypothetical protein KBD53_08035 [Candidatus Omnitrophica bacterium]|nr:hypothetical protein [Candidatus Omnitrophota bacterium]